MNLTQAIALLGTRFDVDMDADIDVTDNEAMAKAITDAGKEFTRASYALFTMRAGLTLAQDQPEYDLLKSAVCALPVFEARRVHVNGGWLDKLEMFEFETMDEGYFNESSSDRPGFWIAIAPQIIRLAAPPTAVAASASDNFVTGYYEHPSYTFAANALAELFCPEQYHRLIVDKAFLNNSKSYLAGAEALTRRQVITAEYAAETAKFKAENLARFKSSTRRGGAGMYRRIVSIDGSGRFR